MCLPKAGGTMKFLFCVRHDENGFLRNSALSETISALVVSAYV